MGSRLDKFVRKRQAVKADRATEHGIAGWQAATKALDNSIDTPLTYMASNHWPPARTPDFRPVGPEVIVPGMGHVTTYHENIAPSGRYRGVDLVRRGTAGLGNAKNNTDSYEDEIFEKRKAKKEKEDEKNGN